MITNKVSYDTPVLKIETVTAPVSSSASTTEINVDPNVWQLISVLQINGNTSIVRNIRSYARPDLGKWVIGYDQVTTHDAVLQCTFIKI